MLHVVSDERGYVLVMMKTLHLKKTHFDTRLDDIENPFVVFPAELGQPAPGMV